MRVSYVKGPEKDRQTILRKVKERKGLKTSKSMEGGEKRKKNKRKRKNKRKEK